MVVCFAADWKHNNRKDKCRFYRFPSYTMEFKKWEDSVDFNSAKKNQLTETNAIAIVNKQSPCTNKGSFENELVPLNSCIFLTSDSNAC